MFPETRIHQAVFPHAVLKLSYFGEWNTAGPLCIFTPPHTIPYHHLVHVHHLSLHKHPPSRNYGLRLTRDNWCVEGSPLVRPKSGSAASVQLIGCSCSCCVRHFQTTHTVAVHASMLCYISASLIDFKNHQEYSNIVVQSKRVNNNCLNSKNQCFILSPQLFISFISALLASSRSMTHSRCRSNSCYVVASSIE